VKTTILKFPSFIYLTAFRKYSKATHWEINISDLTVLCDCSEKEAGFACVDFNAEILRGSETAGETTLPRRQSWEIGTTPFVFSLPSR
jgi:hypothetical protein